MLAGVAGGLIFGGVLLGQLAAYQFRPEDISLFASDAPHLAHLELRFDQTPRFTPDTGPRHLSGTQSGNAEVVAVRTTSGWQTASGGVLFSAVQTPTPIVAGQRIRVVGLLQRPEPATNPGQFDWARYSRSQRVLASLRVGRACDVQLVSPGVEPTLAAARTGVREWLALGFVQREKVDCALLTALLLGDRSPELHPVERDFQKTGTSHLLSSSGARMAVLGAMVFAICRLLRLRPRAAAVIIFACVLCWGAVTLPTPQAMRPVLFAGALALALARRRMGDSVQYLAVAALLIFIIQPLDIYSAGFQFSFIIVLGMLLFTRPVAGYLMRFEDPDEAALERFGKLTRRQVLRRKAARFLVQVFAASLVAWVVSIPLVAYHFEQFTPWAVPLGIILSPVALAALGAGFFKLVATMLVPGWAPTWAAIADAPVALLRVSIKAAAHLPFADVPVPRPAVWLILLFYLSLCLMRLPVNHPRLRWGIRRGPLPACVLLFLCPWMLGFGGQGALPGTVRVTLLSIGAGQCAVVEPPGGDALMVDAGSSTLTDPLHLCVGPFLHHEGRRSLETIYLSHGDYDHISATEGAVEEYGVGHVVTTPFFRKHADESVTCKRLLAMLDQTHHVPGEVVAGQIFDWGSGTAAEVLWPTKQCDMNSNNAGMVIRLTFHGRSILFPADIQDPAMAEVLKHREKLRSDVLVAAHHGSSEPLTADFVRAVNPEVIVSSNAQRLTKKQRDFEKLIDHRLLFRTGDCGAITIDIDSDGRVHVTPFLTQKRKGVIVEKDGTVHEVR